MGNVSLYAEKEAMLRNAAAIGFAQGLKTVQELEFEQLKQEMEDVGE